MTIWNRVYIDDRSYFNADSGLIKNQNSELTIKLFGIRILRRKMDFNADIFDEKKKVGFNNK
jgi:hypothetical protein